MKEKELIRAFIKREAQDFSHRDYKSDWVDAVYTKVMNRYNSEKKSECSNFCIKSTTNMGLRVRELYFDYGKRDETVYITLCPCGKISHIIVQEHKDGDFQDF